MTKEVMLQEIENAKHIHLEEMSKIESVIAGKKIDNPTALSKMECTYGIWFYGNAKEMQNIFGLQLFERLDKAHEKWHMNYASIYNLFFKKEEKKGLFSKLIGSGKPDEMTIDRAKLYFADLQKDTAELLAVSDAAIRRVGALNESKFK